MKRALSFLLALVLCFSLVASIGASVSAASYSWPSMSKTQYCEFTTDHTTPNYRDTSFTTRGTKDPAKSYDSYSEAGDAVKIISIKGNVVEYMFPTSGHTGGYKTAYCKLSALFGTKSAPVNYVVSKGTANTYISPNGTKYGYTEAGDGVWVTNVVKSSHTLIVYQAKSGSRAYKAGFVKTSDLNSKIIGSTNTTNASWQWPVKNHKVSQSFGHYSSAMSNSAGRPYHCGVDIVSTTSDRTIYAASSGTVKYKGYSSGNGYHVIIQHNFGGKTVYSLYSHLSSYSSCPDVGKPVSQGQKIGIMGSSGNTTGVHLHFGVFSDGYSSDPYGYTTKSGSNHVDYKNIRYYNPVAVIQQNKLP